METNFQLIQPVVALVLWSLIMWLWMYATRLPAIATMKIKMDSNAPAGLQMSQLPPKVRWKADNYNHLMEQPTLFYAIVLCLVFLGAATEANIFAAWAYVVLRVLHSLVQITSNKVMVRFSIFLLSTIVIIIMACAQAARLF